MTHARLMLCLAMLAGCDPQPEAPPQPRAVPTRVDLPPVAEVAPPPAAPEGLAYSRMRVAETDVDADVFQLDLAKVRLRAIDARSGERIGARVDTLRAESGAWVVVNGTFFDRSGAPLGLLRQGDRVLNPLRSADWGVLEVDADGRARLVHTRDYEPGPTAQFAVQCGPRVVIDGKVPKLKKQSASRTALCTRGDRQVALLVTRGQVEADALGSWLVAELGCTDALLLDGGPSTQLSAAFGDVNLELRGGWAVPNGIAVVPLEVSGG